MAGLHFAFTADNSNFIQRVNEVKTSISSANSVLKKMGDDFDISTPEAKIVALNKVIRDNQEVLDKWTSRVNKWQQDATEAFNNSDFETFEAISKDIDEQTKKIDELTKETQQYVTVLSTVQSAAGQELTTQLVSAPKFFTSEEDYQYAIRLREKILELQDTIAKFDGSDDELAGLRKELSDTTSRFFAMNTAAAQAAASLGGELGGKAAQTSSLLYDLNTAVKAQESSLESLKSRLNETAESLSNLEAAGEDSQAIEDTRIKYDDLSVAVTNAEQKLAMLKSAQSDASMEWSKVSQEVNLHDSYMVKMLGGYEKYQTIIGNLPTPVQGAISSINGMTGAAKAFIATPLGAVIAAIVITLKTLKTWFDSSVEGQMAFAEISGYLSGVLGQLKEVVISAGRAIYNAFKDPQKAVEDLWKAIKTNTVNRFKSLGDMAKNLGGLLKAALTFDTDAIKSEFNKLTNSFLQFGTGVENVTGKVGQFVNKTHEAAKTQAQLNKEAKEIDIAEHEKNITDNRRQTQMTEARTIMLDNSKSKIERDAARKQWEALNKEQTQSDLDLINRKIAHQETTMSLTTNAIEDENKLRDLKAQREQVLGQEAQRKMMMQRMNNRLDKEPTGQTASQLASKTASENQQLLDLMKKHAEERLKQQQEYEYELWQNRIDLMDEGEAKVLEQMRLDNSKEQTALKERQQQEIQAEIARQKAVFDAQEDINASKDKKYAKKTFNSDVDVDQQEITAINERYDKLYTDLKSKQQKAYQDRLDAAKQSMNAYLAEFGNYQQKRLAIQEEYDTKIAEAQNAGERMTLMAQRNQKLSDLDFSEWQNKGGMALAFGDVSKLSGDTIKDLIAKMEEYRSKVIATFDPDKIKKYEDALNNLRMADIDMQFDFGGDVDGLKERLALVKQINDAEANNAALQAQKEDLEAQLNDLNAKFLTTSGINTAAAIPDANGDPMAQTNVIGMSAEDVQLAEDLRVRIAQIANALLASTENSKQLQSRLKEASKIKFADVQKLSQNMLGAGRNAATLAGIFDDDLGDAISDAVDKVETLMGAFEDVSASIDTLAKTGKDVVEKTVDASTELVDGASTAMQTSASMTATSLATMEKASAILAIIGAAIQVATVVASLFDSDKKHEKNIERLQDQIDALQKSYDNLDRKIQKTFSYDASNLIKSQEALIRQQMILVQQQMAEEEAKKKTDDEKMKGYRDTLDDLKNQLADLKESAKDAIFGDDINSAIENFESAYASAWENGESRVMSARDTVKQMMRQMVEESIKAAIQSSGQMEKIRNSLVEFYSDGFLSAEEQNYVYAIAEELQRSLDEKYAQQGDLLSGSYSQNPSSGGWDTMSQDSADALNGRFTALVETGENIRVINAGIAENVMANLMVANSQKELMQEALNIHIINMGHLETISRHTRQLAVMSEHLEKIERYVRNI